jgi:hypothetical protein
VSEESGEDQNVNYRFAPELIRTYIKNPVIARSLKEYRKRMASEVLRKARKVEKS